MPYYGFALRRASRRSSVSSPTPRTCAIDTMIVKGKTFPTIHAQLTTRVSFSAYVTTYEPQISRIAFGQDFGHFISSFVSLKAHQRALVQTTHLMLKLTSRTNKGTEVDTAVFEYQHEQVHNAQSSTSNSPRVTKLLR